MFYTLVPQHIFETPAPEHPYFLQAWEFCRLYASGHETFVLHTSGSTGVPKPITLTRSQMQASVRVTQRALDLQAGQHALVCLNVGYIAGMMMLVRGMELGMTMHVVEPSSQPFAFLPDNLAIDFAAVVPLQLQTMLDTPQDEHLNSLKALIVGGAPIGDSLGAAIQRLRVPVWSTYGMTETVSHVALRRLNGKEVSESYWLLEGVDATTDERGCLRLYGAVTNQQWVQTNDVVEFLSPREFRIVGRADNIINSGGVKIQLEKVERAVEKTGLIVSRFFAWSEDDERLGQKLILVVESEKESDSELVRTALVSELSTYELPKKTYFVKKFVETPTGKVDKRRTFEENIR